MRERDRRARSSPTMGGYTGCTLTFARSTKGFKPAGYLRFRRSAKIGRPQRLSRSLARSLVVARASPATRCSHPRGSSALRTLPQAHTHTHTHTHTHNRTCPFRQGKNSSRRPCVLAGSRVALACRPPPGPRSARTPFGRTAASRRVAGYRIPRDSSPYISPVRRTKAPQGGATYICPLISSCDERYGGRAS